MHPFMRVSLFLLVCATCAGMAIADKPKSAPVKSVREQIDDLRKGQEQIVKQLEEIQTLLKQKSTADAKPAPSFLSINVHGEPFRGNAQARVAILQYSDFDCAYCAEYATNILPKITTYYVATGKVKLFFRDLPLPEHPNATFKAKLARCAGEQGKFWEMHDYLFAHQHPMNEADLPNVAQASGVDLNKLAACFGANKYDVAIQRSVASAERLHVDGTPAFLIGTLSEDGSFLKAPQVTLGAQSYEFFQNKLDELLAATAPKPAASVP
ncbi:MAG: protein-disulfide isomerase DsbG-like protein [Verrucomicrobiales bacterium]|nr:protein-disulfide isomerase DsbG-like protein [Verrucomicrobiales bacterium]